MYCYDIFLRITGVAYDIQDQGTEGLYLIKLSSNQNYDMTNPGDRLAMQECARLSALYSLELSNDKDFYFDFYDEEGKSLDVLSEHSWLEIDYEQMLEKYDFQAQLVGRVQPNEFFEGIFCRKMNYLFKGESKVIRWVGEFSNATVDVVEAQEYINEEWIPLDDTTYFALSQDVRVWLEEPAMFDFFLDYDTYFVRSINLFEFS